MKIKITHIAFVFCMMLALVADGAPERHKGTFRIPLKNLELRGFLGNEDRLQFHKAGELQCEFDYVPDRNKVSHTFDILDVGCDDLRKPLSLGSGVTGEIVVTQPTRMQHLNASVVDGHPTTTFEIQIVTPLGSTKVYDWETRMKPNTYTANLVLIDHTQTMFDDVQGTFRIERLEVIPNATYSPSTGSMRVDHFEKITPGDIDADGNVSFSDFVVLSSKFGLDGHSQEVNNVSWLDGDFTDDAIVGFADFALMSANFGQRARAWPPRVSASVPEPSSASIAVVASLSLLALRRRR